MEGGELGGKMDSYTFGIAAAKLSAILHMSR